MAETFGNAFMPSCYFPLAKNLRLGSVIGHGWKDKTNMVY
jgi:hypothetical protein